MTQPANSPLGYIKHARGRYRPATRVQCHTCMTSNTHAAGTGRSPVCNATRA